MRRHSYSDRLAGDVDADRDRILSAPANGDADRYDCLAGLADSVSNAEMIIPMPYLVIP